MPSPGRWAVVERLLRGKGYVLHRVSGSHHIFKKAGAPHLTVPVHNGA